MRWKRALDLTLGVPLTICLLPLVGIIALAVRLESPGPVIFRQRRIGQGGRPFVIYKFRTMHADTNPYAPTPEDDDLDPRVTRLGRFLRKTGLDELPQLFNVLKGEMSLVGPRPEMPFLVEGYNEQQRQRLRVKPGITGPWQLSPHRNRPIHEHLEYDLEYIRSMSPLGDLKILFKTALFALRRLTGR